MDENSFIIELVAALQATNSKAQINKDIEDLEKEVNKLKLQTEIDPKAITDLTKQLGSIIKQRIMISDIGIDQNGLTKTGEQAGRKLGDSIDKGLSVSLNNVKQNIDNVIKEANGHSLKSYDLSKIFNLNRSDVDSSIISKIRSLTNEINALSKEVLKTNSDTAWEGIIENINSLYNVLNQAGKSRDLSSFKESLDILERFENKKIYVGDKAEAIQNTGMSLKELNNQFLNLGVTFTTISEGAVKLDTIWNELCNTHSNLQEFVAFGDQISAIVEHLKIAKEAKFGDSNLQPVNSADVSKVLLDWMAKLEDATKKLKVLYNEQAEIEQQIASQSTAAAGAVIQNEEKKQQALHETITAQKELADSSSLDNNSDALQQTGKVYQALGSNAVTALRKIEAEQKNVTTAGTSMLDSLKNGFSKVLHLFGGQGITNQFSAQLKNAWEEAKELDASMTDLSRVNAEITRSGFPDYLDSVTNKARQLAVATKDYIDSVTTFSRAGYNLADSEALASMAVQLEKVGDMSALDASKALLSGVQAYIEIDGYGMDQLAEKAQALNDKIDIIGNTASISQKDVAEAIQAVGSVMSDANTSVDEFLALLGAANRTVQDSNKVALAIRTSALRIRSCTSELQEMGETTDDVIESTSALAAKIKALTNIDGNGGVNILEADEETFRSIYDIYNDISKVYNKMSDKDASALLDLIAGKNRSNQISAVLQNMTEANELLERSLSAAGTASEEYEIYLDSAQAASERFGVAMTEAYNNIINGDTVKGLTNAGTAVLEFANKWGIVETSLKGFLALGVLKGITTLTLAVKNGAVQVSNYGTALESVNKVLTNAQETKEYAEAMSSLKSSCLSLSDAQLKQVLANKNLSKSQLVKILQLDKLNAKQVEARLSQLGLIQTTNAQTTANGAATVSTFSLKNAMSGLGASIKSVISANKLNIAIMGISAVIGVATSAISKHNQKLEESRRKAVELADSYREQQSSIDAQVEKYKELKESLDSGNLSTDEARSVKEQLLDIQNSLIDSFGNEASNLELVNGKYKEQLGLLSELSKEKAADFIVENRDIYEDAKKQLGKERTYDLGTAVSWSKHAPKTEAQQALLDYIDTYSEFLQLTYKGGADTLAVGISVKADVQNADEVMRQFAKDLEEYGEANGINVSNILDQIPEQLRNTWTDELKEYKTVYDEFIKAEIIRSDSLRPLYQESIQAVEAYNEALSSGDGVSEAKAKLDSVWQSVQNATGELEGSQDVFDGIYEGINKNAEVAYNLSQAFENDETVKKYAGQLNGLTDIDLKAINFQDSVQSPGEEAFAALIDILGLSEDEVQKLIDKLIELGYVQGKIQDSASNSGISVTFNTVDYEEQIDDIQSSISTLREALDSLNSGDLSKVEVIELMQQFPELVPYIDLTANGFGNLSAGLSELISQQPTALIQELNELKESLATDEERAQVDLLIDSLQRLSSYGDTGVEAYATTIGSTWGDTANVIAGVTAQFENLAKVQEAVAGGLTMSATAASELAKMYPEILTNAEFSANGQVTLNEGVVKSILDGDNSIINAQIAKLEADKAELTAKRSFAEAQLNIAKQVGEGEGQISKEVAQYRLDIANQLVEKLIEAGMEEDKAYAAVAENMAGNMDEYNRIVGEVAEDMSVNLDAAAVSMAESISINSINAQNSFENLRKKVGDLAEAIKNAAEGKQGGNAGIYGGGGSTSKGGITATKHSGQFNTTLSEYTAKTAKFDDFQSQLALDIKGYTDAISNIDSQIEVLKNLQKTFESNGGVGGHGYADQIKKLEKEKEKLNDSAKDSANKETAESFNWIETAISRVQQVIKSLGNTVSATWKSWKDRNNSLTQQLNEVRKEISLQQSAYESYMQAAESVGLSDHYKNLVKNGSLSIEDIADDTLKEQIKSYQEWYNKALDCSDAIQDLNNQLAELAKTKFDNVSKKYDASVQDIDFVVSLINKELDKTAELNQIAGDSFYNALIEKEKERIDVLTSEYDALCQVFNESISSGMVTAGSESWQEMKSGIDSVAESIRDAEVEILKYQNSIKEIAKLKFDDLEKQFDNVAGAISSSLSKIEKEISLVEESGAIAGESFYQALIDTSNVSLEALQQKHKSLSDSLKEALDNGSVQEYDDTWYEMKNAVDSVEGEILDTRLALIKYEESLKQVAIIKFDDLVNQFGNVSNAVSDTISIIEKQLAYVEESGKIAGKTFYEALINSQKDSISVYESELEALNKAFQEAIENGSIIKGDSTWFEKKSEISAVEAALWDAQTALVQYENSLKEVATVRFDSLNSQFNNAISLIVSDMDLLEKQMSLIEASGKEVGESFYEELIGSGNTKIEALKKQYDELYKAMDGVEKYSDDWYAMVGTLNKIKGEIIDTEAAVKRYGNSLKEVSMLKFNNIGEQYDNALSLINAQIDEIEIKMQIAQESGYTAGSSFYSALISAETKNLEILEKEYSALVSALNEALANGSMQKYDANWYAAAQKISAVRKAYLNAQLSQVKYQNSMKSDISGDTGSTSTRDIAKEKFDSLVKQFDGAIGIITSAMDQLEKKMELVGEAGYVAGESFYNSLIEAEKVHIESLVKEYETLSASLNDVEKYSDNWYDMVGSINSVKDALIDAETALVKYGNALKELDWDMFDRAQDSIGNLSGESDFITELLGANRETMNDDGTLNDRGLAIQGLHAVNYDVYMRQVQEYGDAIKKLNKEIAEDPGNTKLIDRYNELLELQREAVINAENEKTALKELASDGYDALLSRLDELIKARKDALKAASDLHDYEKTVSEQANEVNRLQKLMVNFAGDDSEEMKATIQKTQEALIKAQEELSETEYDRYIQDQEFMLDSFSDSLKEWVNARLDDINGLLQNAINATNAGSQAIRDQINADLADVGMSMTDNFSKIFALDYSGGLKDIVSGFYGGGFDNAVTAVNAAIDHVIAETNKVLVSTDMVGDILNQRFPELAASIPSLDETNGRIGNVNLAIIETRDAMDHVHARIAELDSHTSSGIGGVTQEIEGIDGSLDDIGLDLDDIGLDLEEFDKNTDESLGDINEALEGVTDKVSETGAIANKLDDINKTIEASKRPVEELKIPLNNITQEIVNVRAALSMINTTVANLHFELPGYGSGSSSGGSSSPSSSSNYSSSPSSSSGGNSNNNDVWKHKVDNYPKDKLNTGTSVVDAMKNQNIDSSYSSRKEYFEKLGGSGTYTGSAEQNKWLMSKLPGYKNGVRNLPNDEIAVTQEDGTELILSPYEGGIVTPLHKGDSVLTAEQSEKILKLSNMSGDELREHFFSVYMPKHDVSNMMPERNYVETNAPTQNDIDVSFNIPNVRDSDEMAKFLKSDRAERIIRSIIDTYALGKNPYRKLRY